ncbi:MAG: hypothetical protein EOO88_16505 [Pedobacter sp.]|nr:MAG: hypothetical protein EOO88_16505 [Pedobacter sp.]
MTTGQNYVGGDSHANNIEQTAQNAVLTAIIAALADNNGAIIIPQTYGPNTGLPIKIKSNAFIDSSTGIPYLSEVREAIRSWFCCYLPEDVNESVHGPGVERAAILFQDLDEFLSNLITANYERMEQANKELIASFEAIKCDADRNIAESKALVDEVKEGLREIKQVRDGLNTRSHN